jgi:hypothetical protein
MSVDPASQLNRLECQAEFTYTMTPKVIKIQDTGKDTKSVAEDLEAVLRKIEAWHQGSSAGYRFMYRNSAGCTVGELASPTSSF